jgi:hypothetical protein
MLLPGDLVLTMSELKRLGCVCSEPRADAESVEYGAHTFEVNGRKAVFRVARTTPKKAGQFVTLWQRTTPDGGGPIRPFDSSETVDLFMVSVRSDAALGLFVFPQDVLIARGVVSRGFIGGKRAIRVYPPDSEPANKTAQSTQRWQLEHYFPVPDPSGALAGILARS